MFILAVADLATIGGLAGLAGFLAVDAAGPQAVGTVASRALHNPVGGLPMLLGGVAGACYGLWPLSGTAARDEADARAVRLLADALLGLHAATLAALTTALVTIGWITANFVFLSAPLAVLATPLLALAAQARTAGAPAAPPRAQRTVLAAAAVLLGAGGLALLPIAPARAAVPLVIAVGIGARLSRPSARPAGQAAPPPSRLPSAAAAGLLCLPPLLVLDSAAALAVRVLDTVPATAIPDAVAGVLLLLLVASPFACGAAMAVMAAGSRITETIRPTAAIAVATAHGALTLLLCATAFHAGIDSPDATRAAAMPLAVLLLAACPLAAMLATSGSRTRPLP